MKDAFHWTQEILFSYYNVGPVKLVARLRKISVAILDSFFRLSFQTRFAVSIIRHDFRNGIRSFF